MAQLLLLFAKFSSKHPNQAATTAYDSSSLKASVPHVYLPTDRRAHIHMVKNIFKAVLKYNEGEGSVFCF